MVRAQRFVPGMSQEELVRGYKKVGSRRPFTKKDLIKALRPYRLSPDKKRKGYDDRRLSSIAAKAVIAKHKRDQAKKKAAIK